MSEQHSAENDAPTYTREDMARAWWEGHMTYRRLGPDNCTCSAWNESECGCGEYGSNVVTPNPYSVFPPAATEHQHEGWQIEDGLCRACGTRVIPPV